MERKFIWPENYWAPSELDMWARQVLDAQSKARTILGDRAWIAQHKDVERKCTRLQRIEAAAINLSDTLYGGFVVCSHCGEQETTTDIDGAKELRLALGREPDMAAVDSEPF